MAYGPKTGNTGNMVYIRKCEEYDSDRMKAIISEGMAKLSFRPLGRVFVKPNVVFAYDTKVFGANSYTHPGFAGAALTAISKVAGVRRIDMGENSAIGFPTRLCFEHSGYYREMKRVRKDAGCPVGIFCIDEEPRETVFIGGKVHDNLRITRKMARADSVVYLPKLKGHCVSNMTGAVKLNIGICSDDERAIRHDFLLNEKIVDLLSVGYPDFIAMDAIDVGMGNEAFPTSRKLGLVIMGTNPVAVDLVGARLLGLSINQVPYLKGAVERGYAPKSLKEVIITGDLKSVAEVDAWARCLKPYDDEYYRWRDVHKELKRLNAPLRFMWGPYSTGKREKCLTGCVMGLKMFLGALEKFNGPDAFAAARPAVFIIGKHFERIDAAGSEVYLLGSCAEADIVNARKVIHINKCFTTAADMNLSLGHRLGLRAPTRDLAFLAAYVAGINRASLEKLTNGRYVQDVGHFIRNGLLKRI